MPDFPQISVLESVSKRRGEINPSTHHSTHPRGEFVHGDRIARDGASIRQRHDVMTQRVTRPNSDATGPFGPVLGQVLRAKEKGEFEMR